MGGVGLQLSLNLADDLYDLLIRAGEPVHFVTASRRLIAVSDPPPELARDVMGALVGQDGRFSWVGRDHVGLTDCQVSDPDLADVAFCVVDLETTGTHTRRGRITEIGAVRIEGLREVAAFHSLVNPLRPIPREITRLTGITSAMCRRAPLIEQVMPAFLEFMDGAVLVAHNARFDVGFLNHELSRLNGTRIGEQAIDTVKLARCAAPGLPNHKLATVAAAVGSPTAACHRALADARATAHVFLTLVGRMQERRITRLHELRSKLDPAHRSDRHKIALTQGVPERPGVYHFRNGDGRILYVGRALNLRDRVRSYFTAHGGHSRRIRRALDALESITWEETPTPLQAVVREQELILAHRPPANSFGSRPERYSYLKAGGRGRGLRIYESDSFGSVRPDPVHGEQGAIVLGPFRGRSRLRAAIAMMRRCFPIRKCTGTRQDGPCFYGHTGNCLSPCAGDEARIREHDDLVLDLLGWITENRGTDGETDESIRPDAEAELLVKRLARERRYEDAEEARQGMESLVSIRNSYRALGEACALTAGVFNAAAPPPGGDRLVHLDVISEGELVASHALTRGTVETEVGRAVRACASREETGNGSSERTRQRHAVPQNRLDMLLAVRGWLRENRGIVCVPLPGDSGQPSTTYEGWRRDLLAEGRRLLGQ